MTCDGRRGREGRRTHTSFCYTWEPTDGRRRKRDPVTSEQKHGALKGPDPMILQGSAAHIWPVCSGLPVCGLTFQCADFRGLPVSVTPSSRTRWRALGAATSAAKLKYLITIQQYNWNMRGGLKDKTSVTTCFISRVPLILVLVAEEASKPLLKRIKGTWIIYHQKTF